MVDVARHRLQERRDQFAWISTRPSGEFVLRAKEALMNDRLHRMVAGTVCGCLMSALYPHVGPQVSPIVTILPDVLPHADHDHDHREHGRAVRISEIPTVTTSS